VQVSGPGLSLCHCLEDAHVIRRREFNRTAISHVLRSVRFVKAFKQLASQFEWIVVNLTLMLLIVDVDLWSRLVDGTLPVVEEALAPVKAACRVSIIPG
jgi:hypothetical protein